MRACVGAFIMLAVWSMFAQFYKETPDEERQAKVQAEENVDRLLEQWEKWKYARSFDVGDHICSPVYHDAS